MKNPQATGQALLRFSWPALLVWQLAWHALLPEPAGSRNWILALVALVPLLPLTAGVMKVRHRSLVLGSFLLMLYFIVGVMEAWSNIGQRYAALVQVLLTCAYFLGLVLFSRPPRQAQD